MLKRRLPERIIRKLTRHPVAVVSALSLSMRVGKDAYRLKVDKIKPNEFRARTGSHVGSLSGGLIAGRIGATIGGSLVPGIGTILGAFAGGIIGEELGGRGGKRIVQAVEGLIRPNLDDDEAPSEDETP